MELRNNLVIVDLDSNLLNVDVKLIVIMVTGMEVNVYVMKVSKENSVI